MKTVFDQDICSISTGSVAVIIGSELYCRMTTSVEKKKENALANRNTPFKYMW